MAEERATLPPGVLPNLTDTDPPPLHPDTVVEDGFVGVKPPGPEHKPDPEPEPEPEIRHERAHERNHRLPHH